MTNQWPLTVVIGSIASITLAFAGCAGDSGKKSANRGADAEATDFISPNGTGVGASSSAAGRSGNSGGSGGTPALSAPVGGSGATGPGASTGAPTLGMGGTKAPEAAGGSVGSAGTPDGGGKMASADAGTTATSSKDAGSVTDALRPDTVPAAAKYSGCKGGHCAKAGGAVCGGAAGGCTCENIAPFGEPEAQIFWSCAGPDNICTAAGACGQGKGKPTNCFKTTPPTICTCVRGAESCQRL